MLRQKLQIRLGRYGTLRFFLEGDSVMGHFVLDI